MPEIPSQDRSQPTLWDSLDAQAVRPPKRERARSRKPAQEKENLHPPKAVGLMEQMLYKANLQRALQRVESNRGAPGADGMRTNELRSFLDANWVRIEGELTQGTYKPQPVKRTEIPKASGGMRALGVPTVLDRFIQQAMLQVLTPVFDPHFSEMSFGVPAQAFGPHGGHHRPGLHLGGSQSCCRYRPGQLLRPGQPRSADGQGGAASGRPATGRGLLGFSFFYRNGEVKVRIDPKAKKALKDRIRRLTSRSWGISTDERIGILNRFIRGWCAYFALADTPSTFDKLDRWLRRRLRQVAWKQWKKNRTRWRNLQRHGIPRGKAWEWANSRKGSWRVAGSIILTQALPNAYWQQAGLVGFGEAYGRIRNVWRTA